MIAKNGIEALTIYDTSRQEDCKTEYNAHVLPHYGTSVPVETISEGIQNLEIFGRLALVL